MPVKIFCEKLNKSIDSKPYQNLLITLQEADLPIASSCRGAGACKWCKVQILEGESFLNDKTLHEEKASLAENERLACQCVPNSDIKITTTYW